MKDYLQDLFYLHVLNYYTLHVQWKSFSVLYVYVVYNTKVLPMIYYKS